jgi:hypothetical protein
VNGHDVRGGSAEEAVHAFRSSKEPLVIEVLRRPPPQPAGIMASIVAEAPPPSAPPPPTTTSTSVALASSTSVGDGKPAPASPPISTSALSVTTAATQTDECDDDDEIDYIVDNDDIDLFQTLGSSSSAVSGCYDDP